MFDVYDLIDGNNRVRQSSLIEVAIKNSAYDFLTAVPHPFLVGQQLIQGDFFAQSHAYYDATLRFKADELHENAEADVPAAITRAIYVVCKNSLVHEVDIENNIDPYAILLGRSAKNDITINDYAISKLHALISRKHGVYQIEDAGSTNGIIVDKIKLYKGETAVLTPKTIIEFGRFTFMFVHPLEIYYRALAMHDDNIPTKDDLMQIARSCDWDVLQTIAESKNALLDLKAKKIDILNYMNTQLTENQIIDWLYQIPLQ